ncbi:MAG: Co2+/Mg2+ efflux protein ApaG [Gammaproteobacteria bacterium]|nr:Co2+/Mg2+ efflux protein ApaG [Gammaproteobacteria bacterium]
MMNEKLPKIIVTTAPSFVAEQSDPAIRKFVWSYDITINNESQSIVQLLTRYWKLVDMTGKIEEIQGVGVVGLQPLLKPDQPFTYRSFCQLATPQGTMEGFYVVQDLVGNQFEVAVPKFMLTAPISLAEPDRSKLH